jgi:8-oxo-dGTP pyrophosphatase MutT (NUDIX family)
MTDLLRTALLPPDTSLSWVEEIDGLMQSSDIPVTPGHTVAAPRMASVLIPLFRHNEEWHILYIRRVQNERDRHSGQVAFPGGRRDPADASAVATALREADEEIGLPDNHVRVIGTLDEYRTSSNYLVTPVVGVVPWPHDYKAQPSEVDRIFSIPLAWLANPANLELRRRDVPAGSQRVNTKVIYFNHYDDELLWGATARMTVAFMHALHHNTITGQIES